MKRWVVIATQLLLLCVAMTTHASTSLQEEAVRALKDAHDSPNGALYEHGGMIVENQGTLRWIQPTPDNAQADGVRVLDRTLLLHGDRIVATYHTHPCMREYYHQYFSTADVIVAMLSGVPEFMLDECTGEVHEFFSLVDKVKDTGIDALVDGPNCKRLKRHLPTGRIVGNIGVVEAAHEAPSDHTRPC